MNSPVRIVGLQNCQILVYRKPIHPGLFDVKERRTHRASTYGFEHWILAGGHMLRFETAGFSLCELLIDQEGNLPTEGAVTAFPVAGEHEFQHAFKPERLNYFLCAQTETLSENLYSSVFEELEDFACQQKAITHHWVDQDRERNLSFVVVQCLGREVRADTYHLIEKGGIVIRTQTIFEQI